MQKRNKTGSTNICSGKWKNTPIDFCQKANIRPTLSRTRKTIFDWLMHDLNNAVCLDLFAGSGILGLESLSRNASKVVFVDKNPMVINTVQNHLKKLNAATSSYQLICQEYPAVLKKLDHYKFDIIFIDPPYNEIKIIDILKTLLEFNLIFPTTCIIFEGKVVDLSQISILFNIVRIKKLKNASYGLLRIS